MKYSKKNKSGQMNLSFGTIFSIILIIVFIAFAIFGIKTFLEAFQFGQSEKFKIDLQADIDTLCEGEYGSVKVEYSIPRKISRVCFVDDEFENIYLVPSDFGGGFLNHIDFSKTIPRNSNELCINTNKGIISFYIRKNIGENLITIAR